MILIIPSKCIYKYLNINILDFKYLQLFSSLCFKDLSETKGLNVSVALIPPPSHMKAAYISLDTDLRWEPLKSGDAHPRADSTQKRDFKHVS